MEEVSIIISSRNEEKQIPFTVTNLMLDMEQSGIKKWEIIIADNGSSDWTTRFWKFAWNNPYAKNASNQVIDEYRKGARGLAAEGRLRFCYDPVFSNVGARDKAVRYARYKNIIFADAHIAVKPNTIAYALETVNIYGGIVHVPVAWMGASIDRPQAGAQYSYKIGEKIWGTWNRYKVSEDRPFYIPVSGHCFLAMNKEEYLKMGGYDTHQQIYGGGENYLDTLFWMMGSNVMCDPRGLVFHLSAGRGYSYNQNSLIHNMMMTAYTLGGHKWSERILIAYLDKPGSDEKFLKEIYATALLHGQPKRDFIEANKVMSLEDVLALNKEPDCDGFEYKGNKHAMRIWDTLNEKLHGKHISFVVVFDDWLNRLKTDTAKQFYTNSSYQK